MVDQTGQQTYLTALLQRSGLRFPKFGKTNATRVANDDCSGLFDHSILRVESQGLFVVIQLRISQISRMAPKQLMIEFEMVKSPSSTLERTADQISELILSKQEYEHRTMTAFNACSDWLDGNRGAHQFDAEPFGVYQKRECEWSGTFSDQERVRLVIHDWNVAATLAIAVEGASGELEEQGHPDNCPTIVRAFYLALELKLSDIELEAMLPGFPILPLENQSDGLHYYTEGVAQQHPQISQRLVAS